MKTFFQNRKLGFWLTLIAAALGVLGAIAYLVAYALTIDSVTGEWDRVFRWAVFALILGGGLISIGGEVLRLRFAPILAIAAYGIGTAMHLVEAAYPLADVLTKVPFFGGNVSLAVAFGIIFTGIAVIHVIACFMEHNKEIKQEEK